jgi:agmatinase
MKITKGQNFLGLDGKLSSYESSRVVVLPVPFEATVSYGRGTLMGPAAIIEASQQVELYDEELGCEPCDVGVATLDAIDLKGVSPSELKGALAPAVSQILKDGKVPLILGGEHSITPAVISTVAGRNPNITVVQFDAHADLREEYEGERMSHASAIARVREFAPAVQIGIRNLCKEEADRARSDGLDIFYAKDMRRDDSWMKEAIERIRTDDVYVTIDLDAFDSSIMPATGTPEPGGMDWYQVTDFLRLVAKRKRVIGFDVVELAPIEGFRACDFLAAKLAYKCIGYWREGAKIC